MIYLLLLLRVRIQMKNRNKGQTGYSEIIELIPSPIFFNINAGNNLEEFKR